MTPVKRNSAEEEFATLLSAYDEAMAAGKTSDIDFEALRRSKPELAARLERAVRGLERLERVRRVGSSSPGAKTPTPNPSPADGGGESEKASPEPTGVASDRSGVETPYRIGRFEIVRELGRGGYGIVYLALDPTLDREIALKVPRPEALISPELKRRFLKEAKAAAGLNHPNLVAVYESGEAGPICWIAEEYCDGTTLSTQLRDDIRLIPVKVAARIVAELADGVDHAHRHGVLHRDLKPGNVILVHGRSVERGQAGDEDSLANATPKLTDFGLAKLTDTVGDETRTGAVLGTPCYMAPEQADPKGGGAVGPSTDVYGLGTILYEMLTGRAPFRGASDTDILRQVLLDDPLPPSQLRPGLARDLEAICLKCLEKLPQHRYASAGDLATDLRRFLAGEPTRARPLSRTQQAVKWCRRHPTAVGLLAMTVFSLAVLLIGNAWYTHQISRELAINQELRRDAEDRERQQRRHQYISDIQLCQRLWEEGKLAQTERLLANYLPENYDEDHRDFAWHYLWQRCHGQLTTYRGHEGEVCAVAYSPDGQQIATAGHDGTARLFDTQSGEQLAVFRGHEGEVNCVAFTPDGNVLATGADDGTVQLWSVTTARSLATLAEHEDDVLCLAISPDGKTLASGGIDKIVRLWSLEKRELIGLFEEHEDWIRCLAFSPDGELLASGSDDRHIHLWNVATATLRHVMSTPDWVLSVAFSPDGEWLASGNKNRYVVLWDVETGEPHPNTMRDENWVRGVAVSGDGKYLVAVGTGHLIKVWNLEDIAQPKLVREIPSHTDKTWAVAFAPDSQTMVTASGDGTAKRWRVGDDPHWDEYWEPPAGIGIEHFAISSNGLTVACAGGPINDRREVIPSELRLWDRSRRDGLVIQEHSTIIKHIALSADGRRLAFVDDQRYPQIISVDAPHNARRLDGPMGTEHSRVAFHPNGTMLAITNGSGTVWLWDLVSRTSEELLISSKADASIYGIRFSPNGNALAVYDGNQHEVLLYDMESSTVRATLPDCDGDVWFSPDSRLLATGAPDRTVLIWSVETGHVLRTLAGHDEPLASLAFSPDGRVLATGAPNDTVNIWTVDSAEQLLAIPVPFSVISGLTFAPDGQSLIVSGSRREFREDTEYHVDGLAFFSAGDPTLHGEKFRFQLP